MASSFTRGYAWTGRRSRVSRNYYDGPFTVALPFVLPYSSYGYRHDILTSPRHFSGATGQLGLDDDDEFDDGEELVFGNSDDDR